jgi:hypothetical protein
MDEKVQFFFGHLFGAAQLFQRHQHGKQPLVAREDGPRQGRLQQCLQASLDDFVSCQLLSKDIEIEHI